MKKYTIREIKEWRKFWEDKGYTLIKLVFADEAREKRSFHKNVIRYHLDYTSVRSKRGKKWEQVGCIRVVPLGSYYPQIWAKSWFNLTP